jgi:DNA-binding NarL/FixJ family response regulator
MSNSLRVAVIDDHPLFRAGVASTLRELGIDVVAEGASAEDAVAVARSHCLDVMLLDISMPGGGTGLITIILQERPQLKIVMLTASEDSDHVKGALRLGAKGYILKGVGSAAFAEALASISQGERYVTPDLSAKLLDQSLDVPKQGVTSEALSLREVEVMDLVALGWSNKLIARHLDLQEKTVKHHMTRILAKLGAANRTEAALKWRAAGRGAERPTSVEQGLDP